MEYSIYRLPQFVDDYRQFFLYLKHLDEALALRHFLRFEDAITDTLLDNPYRYSYFKETGAPYRSKLFQVGRKSFWIIFTIDGNVLALHRFWDCAREPGTYGL